MSASRSFFAVLIAATCLAGPARAAEYTLSFTGVITNSTDQGGVLFGNGPTGGQNGLAITGSFTFDSAAYADQLGSIYNGAYGPTNGLFPQPLNLITSSFTVAAQTFLPSQYMGPATQHSLEYGAVQNIPPVNFVQQDIYEIFDGSQKLLCSNPLVPATCTGGSLAETTLRLKLFGIIDFLGSDELAQPLSLDSTALAAIIGAPGGGQTNSYLVRATDDALTTTLFNAAGEFALTSLTLGPTPAQDVPEPVGMLAAAAGLLGLLRMRRR